MAVATSTELQWDLIWLNQRSPGVFPAYVSGTLFTEAEVADERRCAVKAEAHSAIYAEPIKYEMRKRSASPVRCYSPKHSRRQKLFIVSTGGHTETLYNGLRPT